MNRNNIRGLESGANWKYELIRPYTFTANSGYEVHDESKKLEKEEPEFESVPASHLPDGVRGWYNPDTASGKVISDTFSRTMAYVKAHEYGHHYNRPHPDSMRQHEEDMADGFAAAKTGYVLRPFGVDEDYFRVHYSLDRMNRLIKTPSINDVYSLHR